MSLDRQVGIGRALSATLLCDLILEAMERL